MSQSQALANSSSCSGPSSQSSTQPSLSSCNSLLKERGFGMQTLIDQGLGGIVSGDEQQVLMSPGLLETVQSAVLEDGKTPFDQGGLGPVGGNTYCNIATARVLSAFGNDDLANLQPGPTGDHTGGRANDFHGFLQGSVAPGDHRFDGVQTDFDAVDDDTAMALAGLGGVVVNASHGSGHGHLTTTLGSSAASGQHSVANIGASVGKKPLTQAHGHNTGLGSFADAEALAAMQNGLVPAEGVVMSATPASFEVPEGGWEEPNQSFADADAAKLFYGDRILDAVELRPQVEPEG